MMNTGAVQLFGSLLLSDSTAAGIQSIALLPHTVFIHPQFPSVFGGTVIAG